MVCRSLELVCPGAYRAGVSEQLVTVLDRMVSAGIDEARARSFVISGAVIVDGERVSDLATSAAPPARIVILPA